MNQTDGTTSPGTDGTPGATGGEVIVLSESASEAFATALLDPPAPSERMIAAAKRYRELVGNYRVLSPDEGMALLNRQTMRCLGISGHEFIRRWDAGDYPDPDGTPNIIHLAMLIPFGRDVYERTHGKESTMAHM